MSVLLFRSSGPVSSARNPFQHTPWRHGRAKKDVPHVRARVITRRCIGVMDESIHPIRGSATVATAGTSTRWLIPPAEGWPRAGRRGRSVDGENGCSVTEAAHEEGGRLTEQSALRVRALAICLAHDGLPSCGLECEPVGTGGLVGEAALLVGGETDDLGRDVRSRPLVCPDTKQSRVNASSGVQAW